MDKTDKTDLTSELNNAISQIDSVLANRPSTTERPSTGATRIQKMIAKRNSVAKKSESKEDELSEPLNRRESRPGPGRVSIPTDLSTIRDVHDNESNFSVESPLSSIGDSGMIDTDSSLVEASSTQSSPEAEKINPDPISEAPIPEEPATETEPSADSRSVENRPSPANTPSFGTQRHSLGRSRMNSRKTSVIGVAMEEKLFMMFQNKKGFLNINRFLQALADIGLTQSDPRLACVIEKLKSIQNDRLSKYRADDVNGIDLDTFRDLIKETKDLIKRAFSSQFVIPDFKSFCTSIEQVYHECSDVHGGANASYIPQLARVDPKLFTVSVCTVDGQRFTYGDKDITYTLQSTSKPFNYAIALDLYGAEYVNKFIGQEPSGSNFNEICLDRNSMPHNPMINAGAIMTSSIIRPELKLADRYDYINNVYKKLTGGLHVGFNNAIYLSEREAADRNFALGHYMKENDCFPEGTDLVSCLEFYFQLCSLETKPDAHAVMAATLANGGICPITGEQVLQNESVKHTLSLMLSCGMYDYSGQFAFKIGLPAKSGVSGAIILVVPNVMGMVIYSPPLDEHGNSYRGLVFCEKLLKLFNFHHFDSLQHSSEKIDPRRHMFESKEADIMNLLFAASNGDLTVVKRHWLAGQEMSGKDYDQRTALHLAASEGHLDVVRFLVETAHVTLTDADRWGATPIDDARKFGHTAVTDYLEKCLADWDSAFGSSQPSTPTLATTPSNKVNGFATGPTVY